MIVMMVVFVLTAIVAGFMYSMKVEMRLARNDNHESQLEWVARGAVEWGRYAVTHKCPNMQGVDTVNEAWSGGMSCEGDPVYSALGMIGATDLKQIPFGGIGQASVTITDMERKWNINVLANPRSPGPQPDILLNALAVMGVTDHDAAVEITDCILDWVDPREKSRFSGADNEYYTHLNPPYFCKNGYIDDISELNLIKGITPDMVSATNTSIAAYMLRASSPFPKDWQPPSYDYHFDELFTTMGLKINANTAPYNVLMLVPGIDTEMAQNIVRARAGEDGAEGTDDDMPFRNPGEVMTRGIMGGMPGMPPAGFNQFPGNLPSGPNGPNSRNPGQPGMPGNPMMLAQRYLDVYSQYFEVKVEAQAGDYKRVYYAILYRPRGRDAQIVRFYCD